MRMLLNQLVIEMKLFLRDRSSVFWTYFFPIFLMLMFGFVFNKPNAIKLTVGWADQDSSEASLQLRQAVSAISVFKLIKGDEKELLDKIDQNKVGLVITIPRGYQDSLKRGDAVITLIYNPVQQQLVQLVQPVLQQITNQVGWASMEIKPPIELRTLARQVHHRAQSYIDFLVPGLIGFSLMTTSLFSIGVVVVSYREKGKLRRLAVTPLPKAVFIAGQILNRYFIVLLQAIVLIVLAYFVFDVEIVGSLGTFFAALSLGMLTFISLGYAVASISETPETASGIANVLFLPMTFLSGVYFSVDGFPAFIKPLVEFLPLTHLIRAIRGVFNNGLGLADILPEMGILLVWLIVCFLFSMKKFRWE